jgi:hypothetical protein
MQIVQFIDGDIVFNWHELPEKIALDLALRDKIFGELKSKYTYADSRTLFEMNKYVIDRIKSEKKHEIYEFVNIKNKSI